MMKFSLWRCLGGAGLALMLSSNAAAQWSYPPGSSLVVPPGGAVDLSCSALDMQGTLDLGGALTVDSSATFASTAAITNSGGTLSVGGDLQINGSLNAGNNTIELRDGCDPGNTSQLSGTLVVQNLTIRSSTGRTFVLPVGANITVLGTLTVEGVPGQPVVLQAASGTAVINLGPGATVVRTNATVPPTVQIGAGPGPSAAAIPTLSEYGLVLLSVLMGLALWRQRRTAQR
ncbi:MAG: IPTL-CTERM sorting domain-containing protein [Delftia sp. 67-8]|nr:IPTL-CTERM sorting domain-containing protein [Delftia sp. CH05]OJX17303.1 MAG: IPTL-CTERM sorting domain-containing protein [Delftia sp. 67-8]QFS68566.1 IPTL-CTERM sorting domain-containing protein [Delftia tsuruhatensis]